MATVYLGRAVAEGGFERLVAIKVMHPHIADKPEFEAMFLDEARLAASIRHPNVVSTIDVQKSADAMFLVMEYIDGPALNRVLRRLKKNGVAMPIEVVLRILIDTLHGLDAAHHLSDSRGPLNLVHRDVSPQNILVGFDGITRITDFGVARAEARLGFTVGGEIKGKLGYMPPEQSRGQEIDCRADVYAAGVVLWECLTLERLFYGDSPGELIYKVLEGASRSPAEVRPAVPYHIDRVCMHALALDVADRYQSAADFAEAIEEAARLDHVQVATLREAAAFLAEVKPLLGLAESEEDLVSDVDFASIAASSPFVNVSSESGASTSHPHALNVKAVPPSQGRMVTALAAVVALTIGVGAAGVMMLGEPSSADRAQPGLAAAVIKMSQSAADSDRAPPPHDDPHHRATGDSAPSDSEPSDSEPSDSAPSDSEPSGSATDDSAADAPPPAESAPQNTHEPTPTPRPRRGKKPPPEPKDTSGPGFRPGGL
jgi:serine/threonine-protein kinase